MPVPTIRPAGPEDIHSILSFIKAAAFEQAPDSVVEATAESLLSTLHLAAGPDSTEPTARGRRFAYPLLVLSPSRTPAGLAIFLYTFSTWAARPGICLEELYVLPEYRRMGYARLLIRAVAREAHEAGCVKMEWLCLAGNEKALRFYGTLGAKMMEDWVVLKVDRVGIRTLCEEESE